jgi:riboflavin-specific deaminase-like protein
MTPTSGALMSRPYVLLSVAQSIDGFIDDTSPDRLVLSSAEDLDRVDDVRAGCDAILVGATTLRRDNPRLRVKDPGRRADRATRGLPEELMRVVVTRSGSLGSDLRLWDADGDKVVYAPAGVADKLAGVLGDRATVVPSADPVDFAEMLDDLGDRGVARLMVEGGEHVHTQFLADDLADELHVTVGGFFVADPAAPRFVTPGVALPQSSARRMRLAEVSRAGQTAVLRYLVRLWRAARPTRSPESSCTTRGDNFTTTRGPDPEPRRDCTSVTLGASQNRRSEAYKQYRPRGRQGMAYVDRGRGSNLPFVVACHAMTRAVRSETIRTRVGSPTRRRRGY